MNKPLAELCEIALTAKWGIRVPGMCWQFQRIVITRFYHEHKHMPPIGVDAKEAARWYQNHGYALPPGSKPEVGDLIFWTGESHGAHGHVAMRIFGNKYAENSSVHAGNSFDDARGTRPLPSSFKDCVIVQLPLS